MSHTGCDMFFATLMLAYDVLTACILHSISAMTLAAIDGDESVIRV